jgi:penicillin-binding protein 2
MARSLSYGARTGVELRDEKGGIVPDEAYHNKVDAETGGYQRGMVANTAIGQGALLVTPLQQAVAYSLVANGGTLYKPQIVDRIETADFRLTRRFLPEAQTWAEDPGAPPSTEGAPLNDLGRHEVFSLASIVRQDILGDPPTVLSPWAPRSMRQVTLPSGDLDQVRAGLIAVTSEPGGTAYWHRSKLVTMAGKTGTAQVIRLGRDRLKPEEMTYFERDHAWFVAYAPADKPEIVVSVINEHSGHGGTEAAPIAVGVIDAFYELKEARAAQGAPLAEVNR